MRKFVKPLISNKKALLLSGLFVLDLLVPALMAPNTAFAQNSIDNKLSRLENEIETLSRAVYTGKMPANRDAHDLYHNHAGAQGRSPNAQAKTEIRLQQLETEIRTLRGMMEEQSFQMRQLSKKLEASLGDVQVRLSDLNAKQQANPAPQPALGSQPRSAAQPQSLSNPKPPLKPSMTTASPSAPTKKPQSLQALKAQQPKLALPDPQATAQYETAFAFLKNDQYDQAAQGFEAFIAMYPQHALVPNAKYWLGESFYVRGQFDQSSRIFAEGYQKFPKSSKAADNLLKLGMSLIGLGSEQDACVAFSQLKKDFARDAKAVVRRAEQEMSKIGCAM